MDRSTFDPSTGDAASMLISDDHRRVLKFIEQTIASIVSQLQHPSSGRPKITIRRITSWKQFNKDDQATDEQEIRDREITYFFPGRNQDETWRFTCLLRILDEIQNAIHERVVVTKRDIFYRDPALFLRQGIVDSYIDDIAYTCQVTRKDLNVVASSKGLMIGLSTGSASKESQVTSISSTDQNAWNLNHIKWVLVVEKEAVFKTLSEYNFHLNSTLGLGLIVTAKGYPDLMTSQFLNRVRTLKDFVCPFFGLFDCDPYGVDILRCYREGSKVTVLEQNIVMSDLIWLGVRTEDVMVGNLGDASMMRLTRFDRKKACQMLSAWREKSHTPNFVLGANECCLELQRMLFLNTKAEIQALDEINTLCTWVESRMRTNMHA